MNRPIKKLWLAPLVALAVAGCDDQLQEDPVGTITPINFYQNAEDAVTAVNAAYNILHAYTTRLRYMIMVETPTPQVLAHAGEGNERGQFDVYNHNVDNAYPLRAWSAIYQGINYANVVIDNVPEIEDMPDDLRARVVAEARWLRGFHYFNAVRLWGGVPLRTASTTDLGDELETPRSTADEVYDFIIQDLTEIQNDLPVSYPDAEFGRVTQGAAQTLLGKVYLHRAIAGRSNPFGDPLYWPTAQDDDLQKAETELRKVVNSGQYSLLENYGDLWNEDTEINTEVVFSVRNINQGGQHMDAASFLAPRNSGWINTWTSASVEFPFWQSYEEGDVRRDVTWLPEFTQVDGTQNVFDPAEYDAQRPTPELRKYLIERTDVTANPRDLVLLRYGDVLLMLAEALLEQGNASEALGLVNQLRARAGVAPLTQLDREALYWERNWELASEQHAWYDGARFWELFKAHAEANASLVDGLPRNRVPKVAFQIEEPKHRLMPIPQEAIDRNSQMTQNPGY